MRLPAFFRRERATDLWRKKAEENSKNPAILFNAARFFGFNGGGAETRGLVERAQQIEPARYTQPLATVYSRALLQWKDAANRQETAAHLAASKDAALIGATAREMLKQLNRSSLTSTNQDNHASQNAEQLATLIAHARLLDPENPEWPELLEGVKRLPASSAATPRADAGRVNVAGGMAAHELVYSVPPVYRAEAKAQGIEGVVHLTVLIGADGHAKEQKVESGPPLLVDSAKQAVAQYIYKPMFVDGQASEVVTTIDVPFRIEK